MSTAGQNQLKICDIEPFYGKTFPPELYPECWRAPVTERLKRAMKGEICSLECPVLDTDGNEVWYDTTFVPARDEEGRIQYVIVTSVNITERRKAEDELSTIFDMSLDLICVADIDTAMFVRVNPSFHRVLGYSDEELLGQSFLDLIHPDDVEPTARVLEQKLKLGQKVMGFENRYRTKDGRYRWLAWTSNPNLTSGLTYSIAHDITELKEANERARQHREELAHVARVSTMGEMATGIAHELNQPLAAISSYSYAAKSIVEQLTPNLPEMEEILGKLEDQAIRAGEIVRRLRGFVTKTESARVQADLNAIIRDVAKLVDPDIREADMVLRLELDESPLLMLVDKIQIQQVLVNLIRNAIEAMKETPAGKRVVTISTRMVQDHQAEVVVNDAGKGLAGEDLESVFNAFYSTKKNGMGMGLPISRSIVEGHGGRLWAESRIGVGTTFRFTIPTEDCDEADQHPVVLIVDDEPAVRDSLALVVQSAGCTAKCFVSAVELLHYVESNGASDIVCAIADVQMPNINGVDLIERLTRVNKDIPVVLITGHATAALKEKAQDLGAVALVEKPFRPRELKDIITKFNKVS